jgi:glycerophosphoryl diester phosphodiesterase
MKHLPPGPPGNRNLPASNTAMQPAFNPVRQARWTRRRWLTTGLGLGAATSLWARLREGLPERGLCAHRGAMSSHPENTLPALLEAARLGAAMIEFDVQITADGALVLMHDSKVDRTTDGSGRVSEMTLAQIQELDAGGWMGAEFSGTRVPLFEEVLEAMPKDVWLNCHLKGGAKTGKASARMLANHGRLRQAFLAAGEEAAVAARKSVPEVLICNMERRPDWMQYARETVGMGAQFIQLRGSGEIDEAVMKYLLKHQVRVNYYHDETPDGLRRLWQAGVHFPLVNDLPAALKVWREFQG